jgi:hypothetical protein
LKHSLFSIVRALHDSNIKNEKKNFFDPYMTHTVKIVILSLKLIVLNIIIFIGLLYVTVIAKVYLSSIFSNALNAIVSILVRPNLLRKDLNNIRGT